jgi:hypothetical protein
MAGNVFQTQASANRNPPLASQRAGQTAKLGGGSSWAFGMPMGAGAPGLSAPSRTPLAGFAQAIGASASQAPLDLSYVHHLLLHPPHLSHPLHHPLPSYPYPKTIVSLHLHGEIIQQKDQKDRIHLSQPREGCWLQCCHAGHHSPHPLGSLQRQSEHSS